MVLTRPPRFLQIVRERVREGMRENYGRVEEDLLRACRLFGAPNRYLALVCLDQPDEVWWLNMYDSQAEVDRVREGYANNAALMNALGELSAKKAGMTGPAVDLMTEYLPELSGTNVWRMGELPFAIIREFDAPVKSPGTVFEAPGGRAFALLAGADGESARRKAERLGADARIFVVEPRWSWPKEDWVARNPELWA